MHREPTRCGWGGSARGAAEPEGRLRQGRCNTRPAKSHVSPGGPAWGRRPLPGVAVCGRRAPWSRVQAGVEGPPHAPRPHTGRVLLHGLRLTRRLSHVRNGNAD